MTYTDQVATNIRIGMARVQMNQKQLSAATGISEPAISRIVKGRRDTGVTNLFNIAKVLNLEIDDLFKDVKVEAKP